MSSATVSPSTAVAAPDPRTLIRLLVQYREPSHARSAFELAITAGLLVALWTAAWLTLKVSNWLWLPLALAAGAFLVRLFMIQHDCGHGAFFRNRHLNDWVGRVIGVLTMTPYDLWRRTHNVHHASSGNLERRGIGDVTTLTVREYLALPRWRRLGYRLYRNPLVMFGLGPAYLFLLQHRLPVGLMREGAGPWISSMVTNGAIAATAVAMMWLIGVRPFLTIHLPVMLFGASIGVWLFYVQHQFEQTIWSDGRDWNLSEAALYGSSHYDLPQFLRWLTANIGMHHVHHLCSRIPFYRLPQVMRAHPELGDIGRLTLRESFKCVRLALWDESRRRLIAFHEIPRARH